MLTSFKYRELKRNFKTRNQLTPHRLFFSRTGINLLRGKTIGKIDANLLKIHNWPSLTWPNADGNEVKEKSSAFAANKSELQPRLINTTDYQKACFIAIDGNYCIYLSVGDKALVATTHRKQECKWQKSTFKYKEWVWFCFGAKHTAVVLGSSLPTHFLSACTASERRNCSFFTLSNHFCSCCVLSSIVRQLKK